MGTRKIINRGSAYAEATARQVTRITRMEKKVWWMVDGGVWERGTERRFTEAPLARAAVGDPRSGDFQSPALGGWAVWKAPFLGRQEARVRDPRSGGFTPPTLGWWAVWKAPFLGRNDA